jgi:hypothetical protein
MIAIAIRGYDSGCTLGLMTFNPQITISQCFSPIRISSRRSEELGLVFARSVVAPEAFSQINYQGT